MPFLSADRFQYWALDFVRGEYGVITADGQRVTSPLSPPWPSNQIAQSVFDWERWWVFSTTLRGDDPNRPVLGLRFESNPLERVSSALRLPLWFSNLLPEGRLRDWVVWDAHISSERR